MDLPQMYLKNDLKFLYCLVPRSQGKFWKIKEFVHPNIEGTLSRDEICPSKVRELPLGVAVERSVHEFWDYFSFFSSFYATYFSPRKVCPRVLKL